MRSFFLIGLVSVFLVAQPQLDANTIVLKAESRLRAATVVANMEVHIERARWDKTMEIKAWIKGTDYAAAYVLSPAPDSGTVFLKNKNDVWNYLPKIKKTIRMPMNMLGQNFMGTDMTNDDLINGSVFSKDFNAQLKGSARVNGKDCYAIMLEPKDESESIWSRIELWIDKKDYIQMRAKFYDEDLELVNTLTGYDIKNLGGRNLASRYVMVPEDASGQKTTVIYRSLHFDQQIASSFFAKENISKIRP